MNVVLSAAQRFIATKQLDGHYHVENIELGSFIGVMRRHDLKSQMGFEWHQWKFEPECQLSLTGFELMDISTLPTLIRDHERK